MSVREQTDFAAKAKDAWATEGGAPEWVIALAEAATTLGQKAAGERIGYSSSTISQVLSNTYRGNLDRICETVRGAYMQMTVACPVLGEIGRQQCLREQEQPFRATSSMRAQLYHACRNGCPHFRERNAS